MPLIVGFPCHEGGAEGSGGSPEYIIPCAANNSRAELRMAGHLRAKTAPPIRHAVPPMPTVRGAPMRVATAPAINEPKGAMPRNIMAYIDIARPRSRSGTIA